MMQTTVRATDRWLIYGRTVADDILFCEEVETIPGLDSNELFRILVIDQEIKMVNPYWKKGAYIEKAISDDKCYNYPSTVWMKGNNIKEV